SRTDIASQASGGGAIFGYGAGGYLFGVSDSGQLFLTRVTYTAVSSTGARITDTNWHHVAITRSSSTVSFYVDGIVSLAPGYSDTFQFSSTLGIGSIAGVGDTFLG